MVALLIEIRRTHAYISIIRLFSIRNTVKEMPMLLLKCKTCKVFPGIYAAKGNNDSRSAATSDTTHSRGHKNEYMDWS